MIMDKGLENEYQEGLKFAATILDTWREGEISTKDAYMKLIQGLEKTDRQISDIHDGKGGSRYVEIMAGQLSLGYISERDIEPLEEKTQHMIMLLSGKIGLGD